MPTPNPKEIASLFFEAAKSLGAKDKKSNAKGNCIFRENYPSKTAALIPNDVPAAEVQDPDINQD